MHTSIFCHIDQLYKIDINVIPLINKKRKKEKEGVRTHLSFHNSIVLVLYYIHLMFSPTVRPWLFQVAY